MDDPKTYMIVLPKGEAPRPFFEMSKDEKRDISLKILQRVTELAAEVGALPVISRTVEKDAAGT